MQFVTNDGEFSTAGIVLLVVIGLVVLLGASYFAGRASEGKKMTVKQIAFCAMAIALAFALSHVKLIQMPYGGSVTLLSMLFIVLVGYWYGPRTGLLVGFVYGTLQLLQSNYYLSLLQVLLDYLLSFTALGLSGFFRDQKGGLIKGYIVGVLGRIILASLAGYVFWMEYMPESFPKSLSAVYPIIYNGSYIGLEAVLTVIILAIPAVRAGIDRISRYAKEA